METKTVVQEFLRAKSDRSPRTLEQYSEALQVLAQQCPRIPQDTTTDALRRLLVHYVTVWTRFAAWRVLGVFCHWCAREYDWEINHVVNPMHKIDRPKVPEVEPKTLGREALARVMAAARDPVSRAVVTLALDSGVRASEFGRIHINDVAHETVLLNGKGNRQVSVPISSETYYALQVVASACPKSAGGLIFVDRKGRPLSRFSIYRTVRRCMEEAGIAGPKLGPHCLRHSLGRNFSAAGGPPFHLQKIMRHRNIATTQKYVSLAMADVIEAHHQFSPLKAARLGAQGILIKREALEEAEAIASKSGEVQEFPCWRAI